MTGVSHVFHAANQVATYWRTWLMSAVLYFSPRLAHLAPRPALKEVCPQPVMPDPRPTMQLLATTRLGMSKVMTASIKPVLLRRP